jgi:hypothetical protein
MEKGAPTPDEATREKVSARLKSLLQSFESGEIQSLDDLRAVAETETDTEKALIKWASLLRSFDENLYENTLRLVVPDGAPHMSFDQFSRSLSIEPVPRADGIFRVKDDVRKGYVNEWHRDVIAPGAPLGPAALRDAPFFQNLLSAYAPAEQDHELDLLGIQILTDPKDAEAKFLQQVEAADKNFDLARYNDLVKLLEDRTPLLSPALLKLSRQHRQYLKTRSLFEQDYYQTGFYYARQSVVKAFDKLLAGGTKDSPQWIFHLYATGGMGKTMFVKWLISRHCVPNKIPIARLDFDYLDLRTVSRYPWLLILEVASQLNQQLVDSPFNETLSSYWHLASLLRPRGEAWSDEARANLEEEARSSEATLSYTLVNRIADSLLESGFKEPFVVALDTLEVIVLRQKRSLMSVLKGLAAIRASYAGMRLLLSGRYNLLERLPGFNAQFAQQTVAHELKPFTARESRHYLTQKRELKSRSIVSAIIRKCESSSPKGADGRTIGSNPFKLSLFADLYQQKEVQTARDILNYPRTDFAYLIDRIIERIEEPEVQWLLRYAVVPRQFTFDFFEKVIAYHLEAELIQNRKLDEVNKKYPRGAEVFENQEKFKSFKKARSLNIQAIWKNLRIYASDYGWISFDSGDDSAPRLQPDVVTPMRVLLKEQKIFKPLHSDAVAYFEGKASAEFDPKQWAQYILEVIYHRFQLEGEKAADYWRLQLNAHHPQKDPCIRKAIAEEITGTDYVLRAEGTQPLVSPSILCEARLRTVEASVAAIVNVKSNEQAAEWMNVKEHLEEVREFYRNRIREPGDYAKQFDVTAVYHLASRMQETKINYKSAVSLLRKAISKTTSKQMLLSLEILLGHALANLNHTESFLHYSRALALRKSLKYPHVKTSRIRLHMALWYYNKSDYLMAENRLKTVLSLAKRENDEEILLSALHYLADVNLELGRYERSALFLEQVKVTTDGVGAGKGEDAKGQSLLDALMLGQIQGRALHEPLQALSGIRGYFDSVITDRERAALSELQGDIFGKLMKFDEALTLIETAKDLWMKVTELLGIERARILRVELQLLDIGNLIVADSQLSRIKKHQSEIDLELDTHSRLLRVLWHYRSGAKSEARDEWRLLTKNKNIRQSARASVRVLSMGLALNLGDAATVKEFIRELKKVTPVSARLTLIGAFEYAEHHFHVSPAERQDIRNLLKIESVGKDIIPHALLRSDALHCCGETALAGRILDQAGREALKRKNSFAYRNILLAKDRLHTPLAPVDDLSASGFFKDFAEYPNLCAAGHIEQAERFLQRGELLACKDSLAVAQELLSRTKLITRWHAKLNELLGDVARLEADRGAAFRSYHAAISMYERLGNKPAVERLSANTAFADEQKIPEEEIFKVRLRPTARTLTVESFLGNVLEFECRVSGKEIEHLINVIKAETKDRKAIYVFSKMLMGEMSIIRESLGKILVTENLARRLTTKGKTDRPWALMLDSLSPSIAKMPWELALFKGQTTDSLFHYFCRSTAQTRRSLENVKWLQLALRMLVAPKLLADGIPGANTRQALKSAEKLYKIPGRLSGAKLNTHISKLLGGVKSRRKLKALLIRPPQERQIKVQRDTGFEGPHLDWMYGLYDFTIGAVESTEVDQLKKFIASFQPEVIHIQSSFKEIPTTGQIYLDFGSELLNPTSRYPFTSGGRSFNQPSPALINDALALLPRSKLRPVVILDAIPPTGITETIHQLIYRNTFAAELFQLGNASCIIAMGLSPHRTLTPLLTEELIRGLAHLGTFGDVVNAMKQHSKSSGLDLEIPTRGIALFTNDPSLTILPPEKERA